MLKYYIPVNPANDTWVAAFSRESTNAMSAIRALNDQGRLALRSYSRNTIAAHLTTSLDHTTTYYDLYHFINDAVTTANDNYGKFVVRCWSDRYVDLELHFGEVEMHDNSSPVFTINLGQLYFNRVDALEKADDMMFEPVEEMYKMLVLYAENSDASELIKQRAASVDKQVS